MDSIPQVVTEFWPDAERSSDRFPSPTAPSWQVFAIYGIATGLCMAVVDHPASGYLKAHRLRGESTELLQAAEHFGTPFGAVLILITLWLTHPVLRPRLSRVLWIPVIAGLAANIVKLLISRTRPSAFEFDQSILTTFEGWLRFGAGGSRAQGFPSAHTAFAMGFAVMLGVLWPSARRWFISLAGLVAAQRVVTCAHFPSDVLAGAALGWWVGWCGTGPHWLARQFDRVEDWWFSSLARTSQPTQPALHISPLAVQHSPELTANK